MGMLCSDCQRYWGEGGNFQLCKSGTTGWEERCRVNLVRLARIEQKRHPLRGEGE